MLKEMILNSEACFKGILDYVQEEGNKHPIDEVEKKLFGKLLKLGQGLMRVFVANQDRVMLARPSQLPRKKTRNQWNWIITTIET